MKSSALIHLVPREPAATCRYGATQLTHDRSGSGSLLLTPDVVCQPQPELGVQGRSLCRGAPTRRFNQVLIGAQGYLFHTAPVS